MTARKNSHNTIQMRVLPDVARKLDEWRRNLSVIENSDITRPEITRRIINIPSLPEILKEDARIKVQRKGK